MHPDSWSGCIFVIGKETVVREKEIALVSFTKNGALTAQKIACFIKSIGYIPEAYAKKIDQNEDAVLPLEQSLSEWTEAHFSKDALIFIGATGIAVRAIAPFIKGKTVDPAVIVVDEKGRFVISLLSGHIGGANRLSEQIAVGIGAVPVITTATDINGKFAVDQWANEQNLFISDMKLAKKIASALLEEKKVGFFSEIPILGKIPSELTQVEPCSLGIAVTTKEKVNLYEETLYLVPRRLTLGIGCRKDTSFEKLERFTNEVLERENIRWSAIDRIATIDIKQEEKGLITLCEKHNLPFETYNAEVLSSLAGDFTPSKFVRSITGVDNVCERAAVHASKGKLILKKEARDGMTIAIAEKELSIRF
ncbi:cobalt-precorrin 5A hydrolase [Sinanaerobacter sp. ZZT-01]|uniref:cobalt-precorrin 5A hydrolase n=1 Tax=Sinanaerobacter sp. ZZT-01 TaxID=3111540 RepID=UPI002D78FFC2|nr:cobalt-precorrin 5A hydrolase [Sinanaerobacter sp. ZZT-01]WRR94684.1 cobalt-precorrin 5A hydrolase [Sinanaerobacter sp. ZZT-01]